MPTEDDQLILRVESIHLAPSYLSDPGISRLFISLKVFGFEFNTDDINKTSMPSLQVDFCYHCPLITNRFHPNTPYY